MEMKKLTTEEERNEEEEVKTSEPMLDAKTEEEVEPDPYSKLQSLPEDIYSEACYGGAPDKPKADQQTKGNTRLYRAVCLFLALICLVLLLVVIFLSVKLQTGSTVCPEREEAIKANRRNPSFTPTCSYEQCQAHFPTVEVKYRSCPQCAAGWVTYGESCFFLSTFRLSWDESQKNCSARGGSLAVISSLRTQRFLTREGKMNYWIGLRQKSNTWTWVDNTALQESYWVGVRSEGDCGILSGGSSPEKNWITASCQAYTYFICQLQL